MLGPISSAPLSGLASSGYSLSCNAGSFVLTGQDVSLLYANYFLNVDAGSYSLTGQNVTFNVTMPASAGSFSLTGQSVVLNVGFSASPASFALTGQSVGLKVARKITATNGVYVLTGQDALLDAQVSETFTLNFIIEIYVAPSASRTINTTHSLTVGGTPVKLRSWQYEETADSLYGTFNGDLHNVDQRSLLTSGAAINWTVNGTSLIDTGRLDRKDYSIARQGIGPDDRVSFVAMPEMEALLNTVPSAPLILVDPERHTVTADDFEGIYDTDNNYTPPVVTEINGLTLYEIFDRILVDECGFTQVIPMIQDFPVSIIEFSAGQAYWNTIGNLIAMFNPDPVTTDEGSGPILTIYDGTAGNPAGMPSPRQITCSHATSLGVATEYERLDTLFIDVTKDRFAYDTVSSRTETETIEEGRDGLYGALYTSTEIVSTYYDFFRNSSTTPIKTELRRQVTTVTLEPDAIDFLETTEDFYFDRWGRVIRRRKVTDAVVPDPFSSFAIGMIEVEVEDELITYKKHKYRPRTYYTAKREITRGGIIYIDGENQQLGVDYARDVINAYRSGNVVDTMTGVYGKTYQFVEKITPKKEKRIHVTNYEVDYTPVAVGQAPIFLAGESAERDGEVGVNIFVQEQQRMVLPPDTPITKPTETVNMGELPQEMAIALGNRILIQRNDLPSRVALTLPYIDTSLTKGTPINARGRNGEDLGNYVIEARTMTAQEFDRGARYSMTLQARQA